MVGKGFSEKMTFELRLKSGEKSATGISQEECSRQRVKDKDLRQKRVLQNERSIRKLLLLGPTEQLGEKQARLVGTCGS